MDTILKIFLATILIIVRAYFYVLSFYTDKLDLLMNYKMFQMQ